jgi:hypothetical protein
MNSLSMKVQAMFNQDFKEFIESLNDNQVHYLIENLE